jgi:uncharacterized phage protein (predicted DNA packaging)
MVTLDKAKNYLRIDADITDDDDLVNNLILAAENYVEQTTGKKNNDNPTYDLCVMLIVAHWYENRQIYSSKPGAINEIPLSANALIKHIAMASSYPALEEE